MTQAPLGGRSTGQEISLFELISALLRHRRTMFVTILLFSSAALVLAITTHRQYTARFSFLPNGGSASAFAQVAGLAQQFGLSLPTAGDAERSPAFYQALILSSAILDQVVEGGVEMRTAAGPVRVDLPTYFEVVGESEEERLERASDLLARRVLAVDIGPATGLVSVSIRTDDPNLSAAIGARILELISQFDVETRQSQASAERAFAEERLARLEVEAGLAEDSLKAFLLENRQFLSSPELTFEHDRLERQVLMRQQLLTSMAQVYERARIDEVRGTPVMTIVEAPAPPALSDPRRRPLKVLIGVALGVFVGALLSLLHESLERARRGKRGDFLEFSGLVQDMARDPVGLRARGERNPE